MSQKSETTFGHASPHFVPHNFYYELTLRTFSPSLHQLFSLSRITGYRFFDWLHVFGFDPEQIPRLQILLPSKRTVLLDSTLSDPNAWVRWFQNTSGQIATPPMAPLSHLLAIGAAFRQKELLQANRTKFLYAKIGTDDAFAFPDLVPGSIVRVNPAIAELTHNVTSRHLFLVEHSKGICCARLVPGVGRQITVISPHQPYAEIRLKHPREAQILGVVDLEIRRLAYKEEPKVSFEFARRWKPEPLDRRSGISHVFSSARRKAGLSLREASQLTRDIAILFDEERYFVSASSLSNYEAGEVPKHFQKGIALCLSYAIHLRTFLELIGLRLEEAGTDSIPDGLIPRHEPEDRDENVQRIKLAGFLHELARQMGDIPLFLRHSIADFSGLPSTSLRTVFWAGGMQNPLHRLLENALLIGVDRRKKLPVDSRSRASWEQLFYLVLTRDGRYVIGPCGIENGAIVMHPDSDHLELRQEFRNHREAEVVGQVSTLVRKL